MIIVRCVDVLDSAMPAQWSCCASCHDDEDGGYADLLGWDGDGYEFQVCCTTSNALEDIGGNLEALSVELAGMDHDEHACRVIGDDELPHWRPCPVSLCERLEHAHTDRVSE